MDAANLTANVKSDLPVPRLPSAVRRALAEPTGHQAKIESGPTKLPPAKVAATQKAAEEFAGVFFSQMLEHMSAGIEVDENFGGGHGEEMFRGLLNGEYGKTLSHRDGSTVTNAILKELLRAQEV